MSTEADGGFRILSPLDVREFLLENLPSLVAEVFGDGDGGSPPQLSVEEVGDGNMNHVYVVKGTSGARSTGDSKQGEAAGRAGALVVKQALPYVRCVGEG
uniref:Uncharacterized protein n=1 Tax=Chromera velia CCMP2878 TaxID=1169474 RepID=A0A0G4HV42_9ALVE|eukprot:Cvel_8786.t1-p1 / transcript=Cvel_8786.t1 / gene=Cvel_8786 / organism=Chromera_velia_CCMP2878 / gene_product=Methylthioribose kinase, putative / transcript_product=Methylthioribose kinase, putative / location=Cvel_scaffold491:82599-82895(-) / protein_length=99 / sequence_SO=supercontig / SO=protein_coding / is_pseudo=false